MLTTTTTSTSTTTQKARGPKMSIVRIFLADPNVDFAASARNFLATDPQIEVVGQASSWHEIVKEVMHLHPDLVLLDMMLTGGGGPELVRKIKIRSSTAKVIVLTIYDDPEYRAVAETYADGFVPKPLLGVDLLPMIHRMFHLTDNPGMPPTAGAHLP